MSMKYFGLVVVLAMSLSACKDDATVSPSTVSITAPDVGASSAPGHCRAQASRALSPRERCQMDAYAADCTPEADCMVRCIASADGVSVGGGCAHVCAPGANPWKALPPEPEQCAHLAVDPAPGA